MPTETTAKFTPGPWEWDNGSRHILNAPFHSSDGSRMDDASIVLMMTRASRNHVTEANARLIAAAPALLEALEAVVDRLEGDSGGDIAARRIVTAAIKAAKGEV